MKTEEKALSYLARSFLALIGVGTLLLWHPLNCVAQAKVVAAPERETSYHYDTPGIVLNGALLERTVYGPPGYGETPAKDTRDAIFVLKLPHAISVEPAANAEVKGSANLDPAQNVREIQLFIGRAQKAAVQKLIGREIVVNGTLNEALTASQYTKVWLDVTTLELK